MKTVQTEVLKKFKLTVKTNDEYIALKEITINAKNATQVHGMLKGLKNATVFISELIPVFKVGNCIYTSREEAEVVSEINGMMLTKQTLFKFTDKIIL